MKPPASPTVARSFLLIPPETRLVWNLSACTKEAADLSSADASDNKTTRVFKTATTKDGFAVKSSRVVISFRSHRFKNNRELERFETKCYVYVTHTPVVESSSYLSLSLLNMMCQSLFRFRDLYLFEERGSESFYEP
jgi:hypothetical protein